MRTAWSAAQQHAYRVVCGLRGRHRVPGTLHHGDCGVTDPLLQPPQVAGHPWPDPGIQPGCHAAFELAHLGQHARRQRDEQVLRQRAGDTGLECRVQVREQEVDRDRLHTEPFGRRADLREVPVGQRLEQLATRVEPAPGLDTQVRRNDRRCGCGLQVVQRGTLLATDVEQIGETTVADIEGLDTLALEHCVGRHGRTMYQMQRLAGQAHLGDTLENRALRCVGRGQHLVHAQSTVRVEQDEVGEGTASIDAESQHAAHCKRCIRFHRTGFAICRAHGNLPRHGSRVVRP